MFNSLSLSNSHGLPALPLILKKYQVFNFNDDFLYVLRILNLYLRHISQIYWNYYVFTFKIQLTFLVSN